MSRRKGEIGISNKANKEWLPTFDGAVNDVRNFEYSLGHKREKKEEKPAKKAEKKEKAGEEGAEREALSAAEEKPIRLHLEGAAYQDVLREFERLKKAQAALRYDEILMHPEMEAKKEPKKIEQKMEQGKAAPEAQGAGESKAAEDLLRAVAEAKKRKAAERSAGKK